MLREKPDWVHVEAILIEEPMLDDLLRSRIPIPAHFRPSMPVHSWMQIGVDYEIEPQIELPLPRSPMSAYLGRAVQLAKLNLAADTLGNLQHGPPVSTVIIPFMVAADPGLLCEDDMELDDSNDPSAFDWLDESTWTSAANPRPPGRETKLIMLNY
ncbi:uncharacterized protein J7T54_001240 [Emericellopsis cladophorae]|uniref:Uncharacterized protein n=1 Tax=Emericellopsis cladophorae TaxID=2686198 RepID=A0A9P9Y2G3_9HYPO|nr:uncharacterized protein J7T54_001240 [Emericellopsis cladophorae]KAI6782383.1 hypothetical protein J7T54_001240 [Emericellopsis cladophorae]